MEKKHSENIYRENGDQGDHKLSNWLVVLYISNLTIAKRNDDEDDDDDDDEEEDADANDIFPLKQLEGCQPANLGAFAKVVMTMILFLA